MPPKRWHRRNGIHLRLRRRQSPFEMVTKVAFLRTGSTLVVLRVRAIPKVSVPPPTKAKDQAHPSRTNLAVRTLGIVNKSIQLYSKCRTQHLQYGNELVRLYSQNW